MRVALVHEFLNQMGGGEKVLEAFHEIWPQAPVFTIVADPKIVKKYFTNYRIIPSFIQRLPFAVKKYRWYLPLMPTAIERFDFSDFDVVLSDSSAYGKGVVTLPKTLAITYCYTPTRYLWQDTQIYTRHLKEGKLIGKILPPFLTYLRMWDRLAIERADQIVAISRCVQRRIIKYYQQKSELIYPPVETDQFYISPQIGDYYLVVSRFRPYKRIDLAIQAFNKMKIPLKIIGSGEDKNLKKMAGPNIEFLGFVNDQEKAKYLSHCRAVIFPQEEDFGLVPLEAMASGRPVIAYRSGGALETVIEGKTGTFFDEQTWEALADKVIRFKPEKFDPLEIRQFALGFSKERFKQEMKDFVEKSWEKHQRINPTK